MPSECVKEAVCDPPDGGESPSWPLPQWYLEPRKLPHNHNDLWLSCEHRAASFGAKQSESGLNKVARGLVRPAPFWLALGCTHRFKAPKTQQFRP